MNEAPPPASDWPHVGGLLRVDALMVTSTIVVVVITILGTFARRSGNQLLHVFLTVLSQLYIPLITYTISATNYVEAPSPLLIVSASLLQIIFKKSAPKEKIEIDAKQNGNTNVNNDSPIEHLTDLGWLGFLILNGTGSGTVGNELKIPATIMLLLSSVKIVQDRLAFKLASRSHSVGRNSELVAYYMDQLES